MGFVLFCQGHRAEGITEMETAARLESGSRQLGELGRMYGHVGRKTDAQRVLRQLQEMAKRKYVPPHSIAFVYDGLKDFEQANVWMDKAIREHDPEMVYLKSETEELNRANPHFLEWLKKIGLDK